MKIGYLSGYNYSAKAKKDIEDFLSINEKTQYVEETNLIDLVKKLKSKEFAYIVLLSRLTYTNDISPVCLDLILRCYGEGINEIFSNVDKGSVFNPVDYKNSETVTFGNKHYISSTDFDDISENKRNHLEYKVFKLNSYKTPWYSKVLNFLLANQYGRAIFDVISILISAAVIVYLILNAVGVFGEFELGGQIASAVLLAVQAAVKVFQFEKIAEKKIIKGYWLYYSFEDTYELGNYVPKGFTTRLLEIKNRGDELSMQCGFAGSDTLFWESCEINYDYNPSSRIARGFYAYNANIVNAKGKRPEGTCMFKGKLEKNENIKYMDGWFSGRGTMINGRVKYVRVTKEDYETLCTSYPDRSTTFDGSAIVVGIFGNAGSNTDFAFDKEYASLEIFQKNRVIKKYYDSFETLYCDLLAGRVNRIVVPILNKEEDIPCKVFNEHSTVKEIFLRDFKLIPDSNKKVLINYVLCSSVKDYKINEKTRFLSNKMGIAQCCDFTKSKEVLDSYSSTSEAARSMSLGETSKDDVVICNEMAANIYNLYCLKDGDTRINPVNKGVENITEFVMLEKAKK